MAAQNHAFTATKHESSIKNIQADYLRICRQIN